MKILELFTGNNYVARDIQPNDRLITRRDEVRTHTTSIDPADFTAFYTLCDELYAKQVQTRSRYEAQFREWGVDPEIADRALVFSSALKRHYAASQAQSEKTRSAWRQINPHASVATSFKDGMTVCSDIALLAQSYFQLSGIASEFVGGQFLQTRDHEYAEPHAYLVAHQTNGGKTVIFDAARPIARPENKVWPRLSLVAQDLWGAAVNQARHGPALIEAREVLRQNRCAYYGFGRGMNVYPEHFLDPEPERASMPGHTGAPKNPGLGR